MGGDYDKQTRLKTIKPTTKPDLVYDPKFGKLDIVE